jgi:hypothetical protein
MSKMAGSSVPNLPCLHGCCRQSACALCVSDTLPPAMILLKFVPNETEGRFVNSEQKDFQNTSRPPPPNLVTLENGKQPAPSRTAQLAAERDGNLPVWVRAPKHGHEFFSGCSRAKLYEWAAKGFIRSVSIREPGRIKGVRLFHLASVLGFIERCEASSPNYAAYEPACLPAALETRD